VLQDHFAKIFATEQTLSSAQPNHGIDQLNKIMVAFGIKLIKAWGIRGSLQVRGETEVHETKCQCIALRRGVAVQPPTYVVSIVVADACCQDAGGCVRGDGSGGPGRLWWKKELSVLLCASSYGESVRGIRVCPNWLPSQDFSNSNQTPLGRMWIGSSSLPSQQGYV
jgi:hypothetical protein